MDLRAVHEAGGAPRGVGAPPTLVSSPRLSWSISDTPWATSGPKIIFVKFKVNWTPFDFPFLRNTETREKTETGTGLWVNRLVPKIILKCLIKPVNIQNR